MAFTLPTLWAAVKQKALKQRELLIVLAVAGLLLACFIKENPNYSFTLLSDAFLHGRVDVTPNWPGASVETVLFDSKRYIVQDPFPAVLFMPLTALLGPAGWTEEIASLLCGLGAIGFYWLLFKRLQVPQTQRLWLTAFVWLGTDLFWCTSAAGVWYLAVVVSNLLTAMTFCELAGKRRGWLVGCLTVAVLFTRPTMIVILLLYPYLMNLDAVERGRPVRTALVRYAIVLVAGFVIWVGFNEIRFGTIGNAAYAIYCNQVDVDICRAGLFGFQYFGYQIYAFFLRPPDAHIYNQIMQWPYFGVSVEGIALTFTSPALIVAFWAKRSRAVIALWCATIATAVPSFFYYVNGFLQVGMRHALDFEPFLFVLMAIAMRNNNRRWFYGVISFSCAMGLWQQWYWWNFMGK